MPTYTVHEPPPRKGQSADPERFLFVRDGFHFWAFLLAPFWLLARRRTIASGWTRKVRNIRWEWSDPVRWSRRSRQKA